jgi:hypothetical protein
MPHTVNGVGFGGEMDLENVKFKSDFHKYCLLCLWVNKGFEIEKKYVEDFLILDDKYKHHRLSKHPYYKEVCDEIQNQLVYSHNKVLIRTFSIEERQYIEKESFDELLKNCSIVVK